MKKILSIITALALVGPSALSVVSCGPQISKNVLLLLPGMSMSERSQITAAYQAIAQEFNESDEMKDSTVKVEVPWEEKDPINRRFSAREQLPDLYVAYPDVAANYVYNYNTAPAVRDMAETYYGQDSTTEIPNLEDLFWSKNFYDEGKIKTEVQDGFFVLPLIKSFDMSVVNLKLFLELVNIISPSSTAVIQDGLKAEGFSGNIAQLFDDHNPNVTLDLEAVNWLKPRIEKLASDPQKVVENIREFFKYNDNIYYLSVIYNNFFVKKAFGADAKYARNQEKMFPVGIDSMANKVITEYFDALNLNQVIDPTKENKDFFYHVDIEPYDEKMVVTLDNAESATFSQLADYFDKMTGLAKGNGNEKNSDIELRWGGSIYSKLTKNNYATNYFVEGTMLLTSGSSAGTWAFKNINSPDIYDPRKDLLTVSDATKTGNLFNFVQQGPGLSGFKSIGPNAVLKEEVTTKFVRYLMQPKVQNRLAILAGYIPATTGALNIFKHYKNGDYNNETGQWKPGIEIPENVSDFQQIANVAGDMAGKNLSQDEAMINQLLSFALKTKTQGMDVVSTKPNPAGKIVRDSIEEVMNNYIFKDFLNFDQLLKDNGRDKATLKGQLYNKFPTGFTYSSVKIRK